MDGPTSYSDLHVPDLLADDLPTSQPPRVPAGAALPSLAAKLLAPSPSRARSAAFGDVAAIDGDGLPAAKRACIRLQEVPNVAAEDLAEQAAVVPQHPAPEGCRVMCATELGPAASVGDRRLGRALRSALASQVALALPEHSASPPPLPEIRLFVNLLAAHLDLSADELVLVMCLLRRFLRAGGIFNAPKVHVRWEWVVGICCYAAATLTEEFPERIKQDLKELFGEGFMFPYQEATFFYTIGWNIFVSAEEFSATRELYRALF